MKVDIKNVSRDIIAPNKQNKDVRVTFSPTDEIEGYRLVIKKGDKIKTIKIEEKILFPNDDLMPSEIKPIDNSLKSNQEGGVTLSAEDLEFGDGEYEIDLQVKERGGDWYGDI